MNNTSIKQIKKYYIRIFFAIFAVIILFQPKLIMLHANMSYLIPLFVWAGLGTFIFSYRYLTTLESTKKGTDINDFFTPEGRAKIKEKPLKYFTEENFVKYKRSYLFMVLFFIASVLFFAVSSFFILS